MRGHREATPDGIKQVALQILLGYPKWVVISAVVVVLVGIAGFAVWKSFPDSVKERLLVQQPSFDVTGVAASALIDTAVDGGTVVNFQLPECQCGTIEILTETNELIFSVSVTRQGKHTVNLPPGIYNYVIQTRPCCLPPGVHGFARPQTATGKFTVENHSNEVLVTPQFKFTDFVAH